MPSSPRTQVRESLSGEAVGQKDPAVSSPQDRKSDFMSRNSRESKTKCNCILKHINFPNWIYMVSETYF